MIAEDGSLFGDLRRLTVVDLFCGLGGNSEGVRKALGYGPVAAVNHWPYAIATHSLNHPETIHFQEDVFHVKPWKAARGRKVDLLVGSPSCTHFSVAKGKAPKDAGIRSQAEVFIKWAKEIKPRMIILENVREFLSYGPIDEEGHPLKARAGEYFNAWVRALEQEGYQVAWKLLRACDFGAPTSRLRLFVVARCDGKPIRFPEPTHGPGKIPYRTAAECIDFSLPCPSIFNRTRPLAEATMARIAEGIKKYIVEATSPFLLCMSHGGRLEPLTEPMKTITTAKGGERALIAPTLIQMGYGERVGEKPRCLDLFKPLGTVVSGGNKFALVAAFLTKFYSQGGTGQACSEPLNTITCKHRFGLVTVNIAGEPYAIADIGLRMLEPRELARAQGFPDTYRLEGSKKDQIAAIGNAVVPQVMAALVRANLEAA